MKFLLLFCTVLANSLSAATPPKPCVFCDIVSGKAPSHVVWESKTHIAFLSTSRRTKAGTVVIPKKHFGGYAFKLSDKDLCELVLAAKTVGKLIDQKVQHVERTTMILEGLEIDHVHARLHPFYLASSGKTDTRKCIPSHDLQKLSKCIREK